MDLTCPVCGEPWDLDSVYHENDSGLPPEEAARLFRTKGCGAIFDGVDCRRPENTAERGRLENISELYALLGDDVDGAAALLEDLEWGGLL